jgi:hypothetical protein
MFNLLKGWQLYALIATGSLALGFAGGIRWEKGAQTDDLRDQLESLSERAQAALVTLGTAWETEAAKVNIEVGEWNAQNEQDRALIRDLLAGQADIRSKFDELDNEITVVTDFGTCQLSDDAVRLLREAGERTRVAELPDN